MTAPDLLLLQSRVRRIFEDRTGVSPPTGEPTL